VTPESAHDRSSAGGEPTPVTRTNDWLIEAAELARLGEPFALATVVRCERPTSAKPGAKALIRRDGTVSGWIGGSCAEPVAVKEALGALEDGAPRLLVLVGQGGAPLGRADGVREYTMTCHSGGTLEIFVEPVLPKPALVLVGSGPVVETLASLAAAARFAVTVVEPEAPVPQRRADARVVDALTAVAVTPRTAIVVATHGRFDEDALEQALRSEADYVSLVASPTRARVVRESLRARAIPEDRLGRLKAPAGLDLGAVTPEEIAVSILAEIVARRRRPHLGARPEALPPETTPAEARDPVCGMMVTIATARHESAGPGGPVYFCCAGCKQRYDREPERYGAAGPV
jgi:xanthine dehydrogenase accessory factor